MGIYFIAAGSASKNRQKSLDKSFLSGEIKPFIPQSEYQKLYSIFGESDPVFIWGANQGSFTQLNRVRPNEYVVDVKNKKVMNVFRFAFFYKTPDTNLQKYIGWDDEKPIEEKRSYRYVYFLKNPQKTKYTEKEYFARAFDQADNQNFLVGQKYFPDHQVDMALERTEAKNIKQFIGIV